MIETDEEKTLRLLKKTLSANEILGLLNKEQILEWILIFYTPPLANKEMEEEIRRDTEAFLNPYYWTLDEFLDELKQSEYGAYNAVISQQV